MARANEMYRLQIEQENCLKKKSIIKIFDRNVERLPVASYVKSEITLQQDFIKNVDKILHEVHFHKQALDLPKI